MSIDDDAERMEQLDRDLCLKFRKQELPATGQCHWCEEPTIGVFCSADCRDDHERHARFNR